MRVEEIRILTGRERANLFYQFFFEECVCECVNVCVCVSV